METLITVIMTLSITLNVLVFGVLGIAFRQWKKGQQAKDNIDELFKSWGSKDNN